jgi:hypothetical protein
MPTPAQNNSLFTVPQNIPPATQGYKYITEGHPSIQKHFASFSLPLPVLIVSCFLICTQHIKASERIIYTQNII